MAEAQGLLAGLKVVECGGMVSAPYAAKLMADLGADVIKVEPPDGGDPSRRRGPFPPGHEGDLEASGLFIYLNCNKRGVALDLHEAPDREALFDLLADADVLLHNLGVDEAAALQIDYAALRERFPNLVYTWITPFGLSGPHAHWQADELNVMAAGGWASISPGGISEPDLPPLKAFGQQSDFQAAGAAAVATMGALFARKKIGRGQLVEVSGQEVIASALELSLVNYTYVGRVASRLGVRVSAPMGIAQCKDGLVYLIAAEEHHWKAFLKLMGDPEWGTWEVFADRVQRGENADVLEPLIGEWIKQHTVEEIFDLAGEARLPFVAVSTVGDLIRSPHLTARGFFVRIEHPVAGAVTMPGAPYKLAAAPWALRSPAPLLGEHNADLLGRAAKQAPA